jgi:hypothetical protein
MVHQEAQRRHAEDEAFQVQIEEEARQMAAQMERAMLLLQRAARGFLVRK